MDQFGNLASGTDDTTAWTSLIAALPTDKAVIRLHGMSLISGQLGFGVNDLTLIGDGPHTGFVLAHGSNTNALRFNTTATNTGPPRLQRVHLENFMVDHQGYYQAEPGAGIVGALVAYACSNFTAKSVRIRNAKSTAMSIVACKQVNIDEPFIDTVIPGGAANGINCIASSTATGTFFRVHDGHFIDVPDKAVDAGGIGAGWVTISGNTVEIRNLRPVLPGITGNPFIGFQAGGTTAAAWSNGTNYTIGQFVSNGGFNYVAMAASGPGSGGAVTPGTNQNVWWLQNPPLAWSAATSYVVGQCVYYTATTGEFGQVEGGTVLNLTCIASSTNNAPVDTNGNIDSHWQMGGPLTGAGRSVGTIGAETGPNPATKDLSVTGNVINGQNIGGEYVVGYGIQVSSSKSIAGVSARNTTIIGNSLRGLFGVGIICNDENFTVSGNSLEDCTSGIQTGFGLSFIQRQWLIANNSIKLGGLGGGTGILVQKAVSTFPLTNGLVSDNVIDGGMGPDMALTAALTISGNYTSVSVDHVPQALPTGTPIVIGKLPQGSGGTIQVVTLSAPAAVGDTSLTVTSFMANATYNAGTALQIAQTTLTTALTNGVATGTSIAVAALVRAYQIGTAFTFPNSTGSAPQTVVLTAAAKIGDTSLTVTTITPTATCAIGQPGGIWGQNGISVSGQVTNSKLADNIVSCCYLWGYQYFVSTGTPSTIDQEGCWSFNCGGHTTVGSTLPGIRLLNGGWLGCTTAGSYTGTGANYVLRRGVANINPAGSQSPAGFPATITDVTNQSGFDLTVYVACGAGISITQHQINDVTTGLTCAASSNVSFRWPAARRFSSRIQAVPRRGRGSRTDTSPWATST